MLEFLNSPVERGSSIKWKHIAYPVLAVFLLIFSNCSFGKAFKRVTIDTGTVGVVVAKPYFGGGGVTGEVFQPGSHWTWKTNEVQVVSTRPFQVHEKFDDMYSSDNIPVDFDAFLNGRITDPVSYVRSWGDRWYMDNAQQVFRSGVREQCKQHKMTDLISNPETPVTIQKASLVELQQYAKAKKIPVELTGISVGKINPNEKVMNEIAQTAVQQQRQRTEGEKKRAEEMRRATETARAAADNAYREAMKLAPEQYIRLEAVKAFSHAAEVCAGNDKCTMILQQPGADTRMSVPVGK